MSKKTNLLILLILVMAYWSCKPPPQLIYHRQSSGTIQDPVFSPNGEWLAYCSNLLGQYDIWLRGLGQEPLEVRVTTSWASDTSPAWSPDNMTLVFVSDRFDPEGDIFICDLKGLKKLKSLKIEYSPVNLKWIGPGIDLVKPLWLESLVKNEPDMYEFKSEWRFVKPIADLEGAEYDPAWHPVQPLLCYCADLPEKTGIWIYNHEEKINTFWIEGSWRDPVWCLDGKGLVAAIGEGDRYRLAYIEYPSGEWFYLTNTDGMDIEPTFSPDGKHLFFERVSVDTDNDFRLTINDNHQLMQVQWLNPDNPKEGLTKSEALFSPLSDQRGFDYYPDGESGIFIYRRGDLYILRAGCPKLWINQEYEPTFTSENTPSLRHPSHSKVMNLPLDVAPDFNWIYLNKILETAETDLQKIIIHLSLAALAMETNLWHLAESKLENTEGLLDNVSDEDGREELNIEILYRMALIKSHLGIDKLEVIFDLARLNDKTSSPWQPYIQNQVAQAFGSIPDTEKAIEWYKKASDSAEQFQNREMVFENKSALGKLYYDENIPPLAMREYWSLLFDADLEFSDFQSIEEMYAKSVKKQLVDSIKFVYGESTLLEATDEKFFLTVERFDKNLLKQYPSQNVMLSLIRTSIWQQCGFPEKAYDIIQPIASEISIDDPLYWLIMANQAELMLETENLEELAKFWIKIEPNLDKADESIRKKISILEIESAYKLIEKALKQDDSNTAESFYRMIISKFPQNIEIHRKYINWRCQDIGSLVDNLTYMQDTLNVLNLEIPSVEKYPSIPQNLKDYYFELTDKFPIPEVFYAKGYLLVYDGDAGILRNNPKSAKESYENAKQILSAASARSPQLFWCYISLAKVAERLRNNLEAIDQYHNALNNLPPGRDDLRLDIYISLGNNFKAYENYGSAVNYFQATLKEIPRRERIRRGLINYQLAANLYYDNRYEDAIKAAKQDLEPEVLAELDEAERREWAKDRYTRIATSWLKLNNYSEARNAFEQVSILYPVEIRHDIWTKSRINVAETYLREGKYEEALSEIENIETVLKKANINFSKLITVTDQITVFEIKSRCSFQKGQYQDALSESQSELELLMYSIKTIKANVECKEPMFHQFRILAALDKIKEAEKLLADIEKAPQRVEVREDEISANKSENDFFVSLGKSILAQKNNSWDHARFYWEKAKSLYEENVQKWTDMNYAAEYIGILYKQLLEKLEPQIPSNLPEN